MLVWLALHTSGTIGTANLQFALFVIILISIIAAGVFALITVATVTVFIFLHKPVATDRLGRCNEAGVHPLLQELAHGLDAAWRELPVVGTVPWCALRVHDVLPLLLSWVHSGEAS